MTTHSSEPKIDPAERVLRNARIYTGNSDAPWADCIAIANGRVIAIGSAGDIEPLTGIGTTVHDLGGRMVMPGIIDTHCHAFEGARAALFEIKLDTASSFDKVLATVKKAASEPGREWIIGGSWSPALAETMSQEAARHALDAVSAGRPVVLRDVSFHSRFANSAALAAAGLDEATTDPKDETVVRDKASGRLSGLLHEAAAFKVEDAAPNSTPAEDLQAARSSATLYNSLGVTGFHLAVASRKTMAAYKALDEAKQLSAWVGMSIAMRPGISQPRDGIGTDVLKERYSFRSKHLELDSAKFFMDGVPSMGTAAFIEPYLGGAHAGSCYLSVAELAHEIEPLDREGVSVKIHAVGDKAIRDTLDAIAIVRQRNGRNGPQHQIAHLNFIAPSDLPRLSELNVLADLCPPMWFTSPHMTAMRRSLGDVRVDRCWPIRTLLALGTDAAAGTDWPAIAPSPSPWPGLSGLITRRNPYAPTSETHAPHEALDVSTAISLYTINPAKALRISDRTGSLEIGKSADLVVLDRNLFAIAPEEIAGTQVLATMFEGHCVYGGLDL